MTENSLQRKYWSAAAFRAPDDPVVAAYADPKVEFIRRHVSLAGKRILDVGCGNGVFTGRIAREGGRVVGLDGSAHMLAANPHGARIRGTAAGLPFRNGAFDVVFAANLIHHVDDPAGAVREIGRVSARHLVLIEPNRRNPLMFGFGLFVRAERGLLRSSRRYLVRLVEAAGFRVAAVTVTGMISQNNTPAGLIPWLKRFDRETVFGEYVVLCADTGQEPLVGSSRTG